MTHARGFSLVEVLVAMFVVAMGILALAGLLQASTRYSKMSELRSTATLLANDIADRIRANPIGAELGVPDPPRTEAELADRIARYRAELAATAQAREAARFLLLSPPLPALARAPYGMLAAAAVFGAVIASSVMVTLKRYDQREEVAGLVAPAG